MSTIQFQLQESPLPKAGEAKSFYPVVAYGNKISGEQLCHAIDERCSLTEGDVLGVMVSVAKLIADNISCGRRVELPGIGIFAPSIVSDEPISDVNDRQIARHLRIDTIDFRPCKSLMNSMEEVTFHRAEPLVLERISHTDQQLLEIIRKLCSASPIHTFDRQQFQNELGCSRAKACSVLRQLTEKGLIVKLGKSNSPYYALNND